MERESFESEAIAALLNESFVSIKVDKEERPDVDHVYVSTLHDVHNDYLSTRPHVSACPCLGESPMISLLHIIHDAWHRGFAETAAKAAVVLWQCKMFGPHSKKRIQIRMCYCYMMSLSTCSPASCLHAARPAPIFSANCVCIHQ